jgi:hypothetical protein
MSTLSELIEESKRHRVALKNRKGKTLIDVSLLLAVIIALAAPQAALAVVIGVLLEIVDVEYDGHAVGLDETG